MTAASRRRMLRASALAVLIILLTWVLGGQALLGRIDPALAVPLLLPPMLLLAFWQRGETVASRRRTLVWTLVILGGAQAISGIAFAGSAGWLQLALTFIAGLIAAFVADGIAQWHSRRRILPWLTALALVLCWFVAGHALLAILYRPTGAPADSPAITMMTGLPLRWSGSGDIAATIAAGTMDAPALARLEATGPVLLVDSLVDHVPPPGGALLLVQPRALAPRELVAIDAFVRGGGRAVILADALSGWPVRHALGDPRNPPITSLLTPMLDHWGVALTGVSPDDRQTKAIDIDGARLRLFSAGRFVRPPSGCRAFADYRILRCRIGRGEAWLVGDADLLFAPLWTPVVPGADHLRQSDTMEWLSARLWPGAGNGVLRPLWIRADPF